MLAQERRETPQAKPRRLPEWAHIDAEISRAAPTERIEPMI
jgi:hypothetical protein